MSKPKKSTTILFIVLTIVFALVLVGTIIGLFINTNKMNAYGTSLEKVYQRSYYDLEDDINNAENKIGKLLASNCGEYQKKLIKEIAGDAKSAQSNIAILPVSSGGINDSVKFVNQFYGYMSSLENNLNTESCLTQDQREKITQIYSTIKTMKYNLNKFTEKLNSGYSLLKASKNVNGDFNNLTLDLKQVKTDDIKYPSMIYDGPFAESETNKEIKGLTGDDVDNIEAEKILRQIYGDTKLDNVKYLGQTNGKFKTHDFSFYLNGTNNFAQITQLGGKLLTVSSGIYSKSSNIDYGKAKEIATNFCLDAGIKNMEVVWSDEKDGEAYFNLAPIENGVILYPDLVKVKVDKSNGNIAGFEACLYYTNHTTRNISQLKSNSDAFKSKIQKGYNIQTAKLCLAPIDYNKEILCYEFKCDNKGSIYYIYINATTGIEENILQVVNSSSGQKLM